LIGRHRSVDRAVAADHHDGDRRILAADDFEDLEPIEFAALHPYVEDDEGRPALP
jgi:hypothetical protein